MVTNQLMSDMRDAIDIANHAPSLHNSQPWLWRQEGSELSLQFDQHRWLHATDPDAHGAILSCGAALELASLSLSAQGHSLELQESEETATAELAKLHIGTRGAPNPAAEEMVAVAPTRCSDRRPLDGKAALGPFVEQIRRDLQRDTALHVIYQGEELTTLALVTESAENREIRDPAYRAELARWTPDSSAEREGVPADARTYDPKERSTVAPRSFDLRPSGRTSDTASEADIIDRPAFVLVLTDSDERHDWLAAGAATMRIMLRAKLHNLATCALSQPVDHAVDRAELRQSISPPMYPQLIIRVGVPMGHAPAPEPTPRRPVSEVLIQGQ
ncbi:MAG: hypothetical protein HOQ05_06930 [Corynebacteriales bacterium]|nr:hypothetical protein [Mycobacteriales bacterium]